jgi:tetratricopeptide (TPR) repeat protein
MSLLRNIAILALLMPLAAPAQSPAQTDSIAAANQAYTSQNWTEAETQYSALTQQTPANARYWYRLAVSARHNKNFEAALNAMLKAKTLGASNGLPVFIADYELATTYAAMGDANRALASLKASADGGFAQTARLAENEWNALRENPRFLELSRHVQHNAAPCDDAEFHEFDFWLGDWDVASAATGVQQGSSHVAKEMGGCVVWENWTSAGGPYFGKSYNTWNVNLKRWEQYWVDNAAGVIFFHGGIKDSVMDYWTDDVHQTAGGTLLRHLQFFNLGPGKVRQFSQGSNDGGKTWHVEYDLIYTKHAPAPSASSR